MGVLFIFIYTFSLYLYFFSIYISIYIIIGGLLPLTLSGSVMWVPMGWAIIGGLVASTILTLIVVPVLYVILSNE
ncbi:efflux RND transporter permease subunit [Endozoicomonas numazuensis]|uniref:efflux RND transporter permease subunit n=1 Tax=Endozoicomonas numazuensis TaxID=1137799 RepID=UPI0009DD175F|nr:efflux RND transporter permease subunit [Endozoicomonas numazuensis]